jgi:hypothetical protein
MEIGYAREDDELPVLYHAVDRHFVHVLSSIRLGEANIARNGEPACRLGRGNSAIIVESTYIMEGEEVLKVDGKPDQVLKAGDSFQLPPGIVHDACGLSAIKALAIYIVEKGKPLASPVQ